MAATKKPKRGRGASALKCGESLAATYSRGIYKTTTIGNAVFDGRVRNGNGSDHSFMATKNCYKKSVGRPGGAGGGFSENCTQEEYSLQSDCTLFASLKSLSGSVG
jgi:hypothetical protein